MQKNEMNNNKIDGSDNIIANGPVNVDNRLIVNKEENTTNNYFYSFVLPSEIEKIDYSENYFKYIKKFDELENYLFSTLFCNKIDNNRYKSIVLNFAKNIIDWILGRREFPIEIYEKFLDEISMEFHLGNDEILKSRWKAFREYINGNINECRNIYYNLLEKIQNGEKIEQYFKDDILIDGRNIDTIYECERNKYFFQNEFQKEIDNENYNHKLANPIYDRIKTNIYESIHKNIFKLKTKGKNTIMYGIGLESICNEIQNLIYITIFYGSITHLILCRTLLSETIYLYAEALEDEELYFKSLKMMALSCNKEKEFQQLNMWLRDRNICIYEKMFINNLIEQSKSILKIYKKNYICLIYEVYGKYLEDTLYIDIQNKILDELEDYDNIVISRTEKILKAIKSNIIRFTDKKRLFTIFIKNMEKGYKRFYRDIGNILNNILVEDLTDNEYELLTQIIDKMMIEINNNDVDVNRLLINCKLRKKTNAYDKIILENKMNKILYYIVSNNGKDLETTEYIINFMKDRANEREKSPGCFIHNMNDYMIGRDIFNKDKFNREIKELIEKEYFPLAKLILSSDKQIMYEKIKHIKILAYLYIEGNVEYKKTILELIENINFKSPDFLEFKQKSIEDLKINITMLKYLLGEINGQTYINTLSKYILEEDKNIFEALECINITYEVIDIKCIDIDVLYYIFQYCYNKDIDLDIKCLSYSLAKLMLKTNYADNILNIMIDNANKCLFDEAREIVRIIKYEEIKEEYKEKIKSKLLSNSNYNIRKMVVDNL